ncbi:MAG TPA: hypothetical protein VMM76_27910 [Pirellulaceae bacterium]|nr:hypothetical protein [Pirellulaceae bacterium]
MKKSLMFVALVLCGFTMGCGSKPAPEPEMTQEQQTQYDSASEAMMKGPSAGTGSPDPTKK